MKVLDDETFEKIFDKLHLITTKIEKMAKTNAEILAELAEISATVTKIGAESTVSLTKITELQAAVDAAGGVPQEVQDAIDSLKTQLQGVDDLVPDTTG